MLAIRDFRKLSLVITLSWAASGCGPGAGSSATPEAGNVEALEQIGEAYRSYILAKRKPPHEVGDLMSLRMALPAGTTALKNGAVVVLWDAKMSDLAEEGSKDSPDVVLAYEKDAPTQGGKVLMLNRTVKSMTADEFKAAKKAGKD